MGFDCTYTVFDRAKLDKVLDNTFRELVSGLKRKTWHEWLDAGFRDCYGFSEGYTQENGLVDRYLHRTVRHALRQNDFVYWMLLHLLGVIKRKGLVPQIGFYKRGVYHEEILSCMAARRYLKRQINAPTLYAVLKLHYLPANMFWVKDIFRGHAKEYRLFCMYAKKRSLDAPLYRWQRPLFWDDAMQKMNCLGTADFKLWLSFLQKAYASDWLPRNFDDPVWSMFAADARFATTVSRYRRIYYGMARRLGDLGYEKPVIIYSLS
jgi:hypothetical protein